MPQTEHCNGVSARFRVGGWDNIRYVALGYSHENAFRHVKIANAAPDVWVDVSIGHGDLAYGWQNAWQHPPASEISDIRLYIKGAPGSDARLDVQQMGCWLEASEKPERFFTGDHAAERLGGAIPAQVLSVLYDYLGKGFRDFGTQAQAFLEKGRLPLVGRAGLPWARNDPRPPEIASSGTYRYSWHAQHPAIILMLHAGASGELAPLFAAREFLSNWLENSYFRLDPDPKYAWYDHGTADRLLAMILMWSAGAEYRFDHRFMDRLRPAIFQHAQLLASEVFYAGHQPTRYHNHACFQDAALLTTVCAFPDWPCSPYWCDVALTRLAQQFDQLVVRDNGFAVLVENCISYHLGVQRIADFAGQLTALAGRRSPVSAVAQEPSRFSDLLHYSDGRAPAQGDTFRRPNDSATIGGRMSSVGPLFEILRKAGYAVAKGSHDGASFQFFLFATSLTKTHKHEDDLSFTLFFDGIEWLIDPSFYSHEYSAPTPAYLRSAAAHNALVSTDRAYSIDPGLTTLDGEVLGEEFHLFGEHRAYENVAIRRAVTGRLDRLHLDFIDSVIGEVVASEPFRMMLHCGDGVEVKLERRKASLSHPDSRFQLICDLPSEDVHVFHGQSEKTPIRGITGLGFMQLLPTTTIECQVAPLEEPRWSITAECKTESD